MRIVFTTRLTRFIALLLMCFLLCLLLQSQHHQLITPTSVFIGSQKRMGDESTRLVPVLPPESDIFIRVEESLNIYRSIKNEMMALEQKRRTLLENTLELENRIWSLRTNAQVAHKNLVRVEATLSSFEKAASFLFNRTIAHSDIPKMVQFPLLSIAPPSPNVLKCTMSSCFDWSVCSLNEPFLRVCVSNFLHNPLAYQWREVVIKSPHFLTSCRDACLKIVFKVEQGCLNNTAPSCLFIGDSGDRVPSMLRASLHFNRSAPRRKGFDFLLASDGYTVLSSIKLNQTIRPILMGASVGIDPMAITDFDQNFVDAIHVLSSDKRLKLQLHFSESNTSLCGPHIFEDWTPCHNANEVLQKSTFCLLVGTIGRTGSIGVQRQLSTCLANAAIPVLLTSDVDDWLPLWEVLGHRWRQSVVILPIPRLQNILTIILSIPPSQVVELRRQGQFIWTKYLKSKESQLSTMLLGMSLRLGLQQPPVPQTKAEPVFSSSSSNISFFQPTLFYPPRAQVLAQVDVDDLLGPMGPTRDESIISSTSYSPSASTTYETAPLVDQFWRHFRTPWDAFLPTDFQFQSTLDADYRPINHSMHMAGVEFSADLGGMYPYEQFTIIMLCYNRSSIAMVSLEGLANLPYLHSVVVIWNDPIPPPENLYWPKLNVPIYVIKGVKNSLNNRFLPYDIIKTEALLMLDDDVQLRHDEMILAFRVWRENRDRLVGFPARAHYWSEEMRSWIYYTDYSCEYSMILTGAAFMHKYYLHAYSSEMPSTIRSIVDEEMNCEDIAMNFLVSHITRKPPIKVTTHWSFLCHRCQTTLFGRANHKEVRSTCLNRFSQIYGYNPLIYTQFRADSVLFKTRVPLNKQKCFKYV